MFNTRQGTEIAVICPLFEPIKEKKSFREKRGKNFIR
jgi:hypothetical protein